jgi:hypothetical protein
MSAKHTGQPDVTATLAPSANVRSAGSSSPPLTTVDCSIISDANIAWLLADAADVCLTGYQRTMTFVELGSGEHHLAIGRILKAVKSRRMTLSAAVFDKLTHWLVGYAGSPDEPQLRAMLAETRAQRFEPIALRSKQPECADVTAHRCACVQL